MKIVNRLLVILMLAAVDGVSGQQAIYDALTSVERNNPELEARRKLRDALSAETRAGNNLEDPEVEYIHQWGRPSSAGPTGELTVTQTFDFPAVYARRNRMSQARISVYGHEYEAYRQEILLEAQSLCIEILALTEKSRFLRRAVEDADQIARIMARKSAEGSANALEENKSRFEYISASNAYKLNEIELAGAVSRLAGLNGGEPVDLGGSVLDYDVQLASCEDMLTIYENLSPEMLAALGTVEAARQDISLSRSKSLPRFAVGYRHEFSPGEKLNGVVAGISIPLFSNRYNVKRAKAEAAYAQAEVRRTRNDLRTGLQGLYARAELLKASSDEYRRILDYTDTVGLLGRALDEGHISVVDYYAQLQPVYEGYLTMVDILTEYYLTVARINSVML